MNDQILNAIDEELRKLHQVRALLTESGQPTPTRKSASADPKPRRTLSLKARRAIAEAQRKRWAKVKRAKKAATAAAKRESSTS